MRQVIVTMGDSDVFHEIALMEDIASGDGDFDVEDVLVCVGGRGKDGHSLEEGADFLWEEGETCAGVDV